MAVEERGKLVLEKKGRDVEKYSVPDLNAVLSWHQVKKFVRRNTPPPTFKQWTIDNETMLQEASQANLEVGYTALG